jgi:hypothetical protein
LLIEFFETGHSNMPPMLYERWRGLCKVSAKEFYTRMLWVLTPAVVRGLFPEDPLAW